MEHIKRVNELYAGGSPPSKIPYNDDESKDKLVNKIISKIKNKDYKLVSIEKQGKYLVEFAIKTYIVQLWRESKPGYMDRFNLTIGKGQVKNTIYGIGERSVKEIIDIIENQHPEPTDIVSEFDTDLD